MRALRPIILLACLMGVGLSSPPPVPAQGHGTGGQMGRETEVFLSSVHQEWRQAWELSRQANNPEVRALLAQAQTLLDQARAAYRQGHLMRARTMGESARNLIRRANQLMRQGQQSGVPQQAERALREAEEILARLHRQDSMGPHSHRVEALIQQARQAAMEGRYEQAVRLATLAQEQGRRAWHNAMQSRMMRQRCVALEHFVEPLVERAERLAQERGDERAIRASTRARERLQMARQMDLQTQAVQRARLLESAMREAEQVLEALDRRGFERLRAMRALAEAQSALDRATEAAGEQPDENVQAMLDQGRKALEQAQEKLDAGEFVAARAIAEHARRTAQQAIRHALGPISEERVAEALAHTDQLLEQSAEVSTPEAQRLLERARQRQEEAHQLFEEGKLRQALVRTRIAARLARQARELDR